MEISLEITSMKMLNVGYVEHNGDWNWKNVCSPFTRIYYVTGGEALVRTSKKVIHLVPDHLYVIPANVEHSCECTGYFAHYYLHMFESHSSGNNFLDFYEFPSEVVGTPIDKSMFEELCVRFPEAQLPSSDPQAYDNNDTFTSYIQRCSDMPVFEKVLIEGFINVLYSRFLKDASTRPWTTDVRVTQLLKYINQHICDNIEIDDLAGVACVTKSYLIRVFKQIFGISPLQYINKKKMEKAQLFLITEDVTVKEVAYKLGYNDHSYFNRLFKKLCGETPRQYRVTMRQNRNRTQ